MGTDVFNDLSYIASAIVEQKRMGTPSWYLLKDYLQEHLPAIYEQLITNVDSSHAQSFAFKYWAGGGDLKNLEELHDELRNALYPKSSDGTDEMDIDAALAKIQGHAIQTSENAPENVWRLSLNQRKLLLDEWVEAVDPDLLLNRLVDLQLDHCQANNRMIQARQAIDAQCLAKRDVIGMTTTACARNWSLLKRLDIEVVMCEEAGEVMEPHTVCSLFQTVEHAIFIGDPLQLRPQVEEHILKTEMNSDPDYRLDESLFEKLMCPRDPDINPIPTSRLNIQRRMHPDIAAITRLTYPNLLDHSFTALHPSTDGLQRRMFWFNHNFPETVPEESPTKSFSNDFEANMIFGLIKYFLRGGAYALGEIAVITPYKGQLALLKRTFEGTCPIWLHPKDRQELIDDGLLEESSHEIREELAPGDLLRLATVDNFQGEEAKIIILSIVRTSSPGFLRTENRVNVMCSRARDGFYIFGSAEAFYKVPIWADIISIFVTRGGRFGSTLVTCCSRHPDHLQKITEPDDFDRIPACPQKCLQKRACGHICQEPCHAAPHDSIACTQPCLKLHEGCGHECNRNCGEDCGTCSKVLYSTRLECGHEVDVVCPGVPQSCQKPIDEVDAPCGKHKIKVFCSTANHPLVCNEQCGASLRCGHLCEGKCSECFLPDGHLPCSKTCGKPLGCGHICTAECHWGLTKCPPCSRPCRQACPHGTCKSVCSAPCDPCIRPHKPACEHEESGLTLCSLPSLALPCNRPCGKRLPCGHSCSSLCGEPCIPLELCPQCQYPGAHSEDERHIFLQPCGHLFDMEVLDMHLLEGIYHRSVDTGAIDGFQPSDVRVDHTTCPHCSKPIIGNRRYAIVNQIHHAVDNEDLLMFKIGKKLNVCARAIHRVEKQLHHQSDDLRDLIRPNPLAGKANKRVIQERSLQILELQRQVIDAQQNLAVPFEASIVRLKPLFSSYIKGSILPFVLRFELLLARARLVWIQDNLQVADYLFSLSDPSEELPRMAVLLRKNSLGPCMESQGKCLEAIESARASKFPAIETEFRVYFLLFAYFESRCRLLCAPPSDSPSPLSPLSPSSSSAPFQPGDSPQLTANVKEAAYLCKHYPRTTGKFQRCLDELTRFFAATAGDPPHHQQQQHSIPFPPTIFTARTRLTEQLWGEHQLGALVECPNGHPYSGKTFGGDHGGCPECEPIALDIEQEAARNAHYLREGEFMAMVRERIEQR